MKVTQLFLRVIYLPVGIIKTVLAGANAYCRDFENKVRYRQSSLDHNVCVTPDTQLGAKTKICESCILNHCVVGNYTYVSRKTVVQNAEIGNYCSISYEVLIGLGAHPLDKFSTSPLFYRSVNIFRMDLGMEDESFEDYRPISIGDDVWIGARAIILDGVKIGRGAVVAAGAVVTKDVPEYAIVAGCPAKVIRKRVDEATARRYNQSQWWKLAPQEVCERMK